MEHRCRWMELGTSLALVRPHGAVPAHTPRGRWFVRPDKGSRAWGGHTGTAPAHADPGEPPTGPGEDTGGAPLSRLLATLGGALRPQRFAALRPGRGGGTGQWDPTGEMSFYDVFRGFFGFPGRCR